MNQIIENNIISKQWNAISFMKCIAAILITNAHIGPFYPEGYDWMSFGGALGNSLFFFCSGYALIDSIKDKSFLQWYSRRLKRLYPTIWLVMAVFVLIGYGNYRIIDFIVTPYWFINTIIVFYAIFYFVVKYTRRNLSFLIGILFLGMVVEFSLISHDKWVMEENANSLYLHYWYYFAIMLIGAIVSDKEQARPNNSYQGTFLIITFISFLIYMGIKYYILHTLNPLYESQLLLPICLTVFAICIYYSSVTIANILFKMKIRGIIKLLSTITLEIYIVQFGIANLLQNLKFPLGLIILVISIVLSAYFVHFLIRFTNESIRSHTCL